MPLAIIPARGGSRRIPNKNRRYFHGKPIIAYSIQAAKESELFNLVIVSTDDPETMRIAKYYGAEVHKRSPELCLNEVGTEDVTRAVLTEYLEKMKAEKVSWAKPGESIDSVCCLYPTAPLITSAELVLGYQMLQNMNANHVIAKDEDQVNAGTFWWSTTEALLKGIPYDGPGSLPILFPREQVIDINTEDDWTFAERMYAERKQ